MGRENTSGDASTLSPLPHLAPQRGLRGELTQAGACVGALNDDVFAGVVED